jgi:hypothetical protein
MVCGGACSYKMQGRIHYGMCHAKHCIQYTVLHFALQRSKKSRTSGPPPLRYGAPVDLRFEKRLSVWPRRLVRHGPAPAHGRQHKDADVFVPEGPDDRSQAIYCLESRSKRDPSRRDGVIGSDRRATIGTTNQPWVRIRPCPTGRILD